MMGWLRRKLEAWPVNPGRMARDVYSECPRCGNFSLKNGKCDRCPLAPYATIPLDPPPRHPEHEIIEMVRWDLLCLIGSIYPQAGKPDGASPSSVLQSMRAHYIHSLWNACELRKLLRAVELAEEEERLEQGGM